MGWETGGSTITNHDAYSLAGIVNSSGQPLGQVYTDVSINQIQNKTSSGKNFPNFKKTFQMVLPILGFLLRILGHLICRRSLNRYSLNRNLKHLFKRKRLTGWFPRQRQLCWSSLMLTFLIIFTYEIENRKNPYHFIKNQQKYDLFTKESLSLIGDIKSDYLQEQLSVWALSDLKLKIMNLLLVSLCCSQVIFNSTQDLLKYAKPVTNQSEKGSLAYNVVSGSTKGVIRYLMQSLQLFQHRWEMNLGTLVCLARTTSR